VCLLRLRLPSGPLTPSRPTWSRASWSSWWSRWKPHKKVERETQAGVTDAKMQEYRRLASKRDSDAQYQIALAYKIGEYGVEQSNSEAMRWPRMAVEEVPPREAGTPPSMSAQCCLGGRGLQSSTL
jgi:hypothetical protein